MSSADQTRFAMPIRTLPGVSGILQKIDQIERLISEIPDEHITDVQAAVTQMFAHRLENNDKNEDSSDCDDSPEVANTVEPPKKKRKSKKPSEMEELKAIQTWLREKVPVEAVLPSEKIIFNRNGEFESYTAENTVSVDGFLYEDDDIDELCDAGKLSRNFCLECGCRRTQPLNFVSHSLSIPELQFIFKQVLPKACKGGLKDKTVIDVGSRLGAVVYAAVLLGGCGKAIGIEINEELCRLQEEALTTFSLASRGRVVCADVATQAEALGAADVVLLHNAFQFFQTPAQSAAAWQAIRDALRPGALVVACPSLDEQLRACVAPGAQAGEAGGVPWEAAEWVEEVGVAYPRAEDPDDEHADEEGRLYTSIRLYRVRPPAAAAH